MEAKNEDLILADPCFGYDNEGELGIFGPPVIDLPVGRDDDLHVCNDGARLLIGPPPPEEPDTPVNKL